MKHALSRQSAAALRALLLDAERVDRSIKGVLRNDPWGELEGLVARLSGVKLSRAA
jgi:hypothetical protein